MGKAIVEAQRGELMLAGNISLAQVVSEQLWKRPGALDKVANVTFAATALDQLPPMMRPALAAVTVNPDPKASDVYPLPGGKCGLSKPIIHRMLAAVGASVEWTKRTSPAGDLDNVEWQAQIAGYTPDGQFRRVVGSKSWSWQQHLDKCIREAAKNGKSRAEGERTAAQFRDFAHEHIETRAILRAARAFLTIQTSYTAEQLQRPFLLARAIPDLDPHDPEVKQALIARAMGGVAALYPNQGLPGHLSSQPPDVLPEHMADDDEDEEPAAQAQPEPEPLPTNPPPAPAGQPLQGELEVDPMQPAASGPPNCKHCKQAITDHEYRGRAYTASQIVDASLADFPTDGPFCFRCFQAWKSAGGRPAAGG